MKLELKKINENRYRFITKSTKKHPALLIIGKFLKELNKSSFVKIGLFSVHMPSFSNEAKIYSFLTGKSERMNKKQYRKWAKGERQLTAENNPEKIKESQWLSRKYKKEELTLK